MDPNLGGLKAYGSDGFGSGSATLVHEYCPASPEKEDQRAAGSPAALTQLALCLRLAPDLKGRKLATRRNPQ